jgi:hypothetical protein
MAERQRVARRVRADDLFPEQSTWWPPGISLDEWRTRARGEPVAYWSDARERDVNDWWAATQPNRDRYRTEER